MYLDLIVSNLLKVLLCGALYLGAYFSNIILGTWRNVCNLRENFDLEKIYESIAQMSAFIFGVGLLCITLTSIPIAASYVGWEIPLEFQSGFSNAVIFGIFLLGALYKAKDAIEKAQVLIFGKDEKKEEIANQNSLIDLLNEAEVDTQIMLNNESKHA